MTDVFISYSRKDKDFASRLVTALEADERDVWVDWQDIPWAEQWRKEIEDGIEHANSFIFIVSQHSLTSEVCNYELAYARSQNKRIIPIIRERIDGDKELRVKRQWLGLDWQETAATNWTELGHINWIFAQEDDRFTEMFTEVADALDADHQHTKQHTRYQVRALEWQRADENPSFLLIGDEITSAERWLNTATNKTPAPSDLHRQFISQSRQNEEERLKQAQQTARNISLFRRSSLVLLVSVILVGSLAFYAWQLFGQARTAGDLIAGESTIDALRQERIATLAAADVRIQATQLSADAVNLVATETQIAVLSMWNVTETVTSSVAMVYVPTGCFWMGSTLETDEQGRNEVCLNAFWIDRYEVWNEQFESLAGEAAFTAPWDDPMQPRTDISWEEAQSFCEARGGRLPTEEEWEYAARGPNSLRYPYGNDFISDNVYADASYREPVDVTTYEQGASWVGAHHMSGNVVEWVYDIYQPYVDLGTPTPLSDTIQATPTSALIVGDRVFRGGDYNSLDTHILSASDRSRASQNGDRSPSPRRGFRCVIDAE